MLANVTAPTADNPRFPPTAATLCLSSLATEPRRGGRILFFCFFAEREPTTATQRSPARNGRHRSAGIQSGRRKIAGSDPGRTQEPLCALVGLEAGIDHRSAQTLIRCHCRGFQLFWRWKAKPGTLTTFFYRNQGTPSESHSLLINTFSVTAKWYFGRDAAVPFWHQLRFRGPASLDQTKSARNEVNVSRLLRTVVETIRRECLDFLIPLSERSPASK